MKYTIVEDNGLYWVADDIDYIAGPFLHLWEAERELDGWMEVGEDDDE